MYENRGYTLPSHLPTAVPVVSADHKMVNPTPRFPNTCKPADPVCNLPNPPATSFADRSQYSDVLGGPQTSDALVGNPMTEPDGVAYDTVTPILRPRTCDPADSVYNFPKQSVPLSDRSGYSDVLGGAQAVVGDPVKKSGGAASADPSNSKHPDNSQYPKAVGGDVHTTESTDPPRSAAAFCHFSVQDVTELLREIQLDSFVDTFQRQGVDGALLEQLDEQMLTEPDFAMSRFQARKLMLSVKHGWRPKHADTSNS